MISNSLCHVCPLGFSRRWTWKRTTFLIHGFPSRINQEITRNLQETPQDVVPNQRGWKHVLFRCLELLNNLRLIHPSDEAFAG